MTRKDFELISGAVRYVSELKTTDRDTLYLVAYALSTELGKSNSAFDKARFMADCGVMA